MGHADRPRLHYALGLDAQSRRVCLPTARRCESNTNTNGYTCSIRNAYCNSSCYCYTNGYCCSYGNSDAYCDSNTYADSNTDSEAYTHAQAATDAAPSPIVRSGSDKWLLTGL